MEQQRIATTGSWTKCQRTRVIAARNSQPRTRPASYHLNEAKSLTYGPSFVFKMDRKLSASQIPLRAPLQTLVIAVVGSYCALAITPWSPLESWQILDSPLLHTMHATKTHNRILACGRLVINRQLCTYTCRQSAGWRQ